MSGDPARGGSDRDDATRTADAEEPGDAELDRLEAALGHVFADRALLDRALCHASFANERSSRFANERSSGRGPSARTEGDGARGEEPGVESNERLEFLGDAVLGLVVARALYAAHPGWREGQLTRALHAIVEGRSLARLARRLGVGDALRLGRTERASGGAEKPSILEDAMEAIVGAIYLDGGLAPVEAFVARHFAAALAEGAAPVARDPKTALQEQLMAEVGEFPGYTLVQDSGEEGDDDRFTVEVVSCGVALARGTGRTKRQAERRAARRALEARTSDAAGARGHEEASGR